MSEFTDGMAKFVVTKSLGVLTGTVTAFSGAFSDGYPVDKNTGLVNKEWHLCDGTNGTPDLRNRFIYGGDGTNNGSTGGEEKHQLTTDELPSNMGKIHSALLWGGSCEGIVKEISRTRDRTAPNGLNFGGTELNFSGGNQPHNNMPPYYVLAWIMKL